MPFISKEESAAIRKELKKAFPKSWKFSVRIEHHTSLDVVIKEGPIKFSCRDGCQVNQWRLNDFTGEEKQALEKLFAIINQVKPKKTVCNDSDYGAIPNYYLNVSIGDWNKSYKQVLDQDGILQKLIESRVNVVGSLTNIALDSDFYLRLAGIFTDKDYLVKDADLKLAMGKYCIAQNEVRKGA